MIPRTAALSLLGVLLLRSTPAAAQEASATPSLAASLWGADYFPNVELTSHQGRVVRFFDDLIRDKVVVVSFLYTNCPDACPLETARLVEVQEVLGERVGRDVFFYSISIDPARDSVAALAQYAERFQVGPGWLFLRGEERDVRLIRQKLGVLGADETELEDHSLSVVIGNQATGRWMRRSPFENAFVLADEIGAWLHNWKSPTVVDEDYADAPELRSVSRGESLFRTRCSACHGIGAGDGLARTGPNLAGVVEWRDRAWLERWIREPDRMLVERDELALTLFEAYRGVPMPNMRLNELEVAAVIEYMQEESTRAFAAERAVPVEFKQGCCLEKEIAPGSQAEDPWDADPAVPAPPAVLALEGGDGPAPGPTLGVAFGLLLGAGCVASALGRRDSAAR